MKDKLRELAGEMRNELCSDFAQKLEAILDAEGEGDGGAVEYFSANPAEGEFSTHKSLAEAVAGAESLLEYAQDEASDWGWTDEPPQICYGVVLGGCIEKEGSRRPAPEGSDFSETVDFELTSYTHPARSGVVRDATPEMCDSVRYLLVGMGRAGRTFGSVRDHCRMSGMDVENWPHWTINRETEHFNKSACAALIWWLMHRAAIQGERHER